MKRYILTGIVAAVTLHLYAREVPSEELMITPDPTQKYQQIEGWGSSLCWWAGQVGNWDEEKVDEIVDIITSPDKLNMNIFRYNIGGGDDPTHTDGHMTKGKGKRAEMEGFRDAPDAPYNWHADKAQRNILLKIKAKRKDAVFEAFSNSAPYWMTWSGCSAGHKDAGKDNLKPEYYDMFCDYLVDVCKHYKETYNVDFKTLEPFNESYSHYWYALGSQEGCHFNPETQVEIIRRLYPKLKASGLKTVLSASDETNLDHFLTVQDTYRKAGDIWEKLGQLNTHTYSGSNEERQKVHRLTVEFGKPFWQSETGPSTGNGLESNLCLTQKMFDDLNIMHPQAWLDWQLMEEGNTEWCVMRCNFRTQEYELIKNLYVRMQITRFFKQGYTLIDSGSRHVLAALSPENKELVLAILNTEEIDAPYTIDLNRFPKKVRSLKSWRTGKEEDCKELSVPKTKKNILHYTAPGMSLTTFVVKM